MDNVTPEQQQALDAIAAGSHAPSVNGTAPPAADVHAEAAPAAAEPKPAAAKADQPIDGDVTVLAARVAQLEVELKQQRRSLTVAVILASSCAIMLLYQNAPDAIEARATMPLPTPEPVL